MVKGPDGRGTETRGRAPGGSERDRHGADVHFAHADVIHADFSHRGHTAEIIHTFAEVPTHVGHGAATPRDGDDAGEAEREARSEAQRAAASDEMQRLRIEHRDLDAAIDALGRLPCDQLQLQRLKRRKLALRDRIRQLEDQITPDIIA